MVAKLTPLTDIQKEKLVPLLLTDAYLEHNNSSGNTRFGFDQVNSHSDFFMEVKNSFQNYLSPTNQTKTKPEQFERKTRDNQLTLRTKYDKAFNEYYDLFYPNGGPKIAPKLSILTQYISWQGLAYALMADGSRKGDEGYGITLCLHSLSYESVGRVAMALHKNLGLFAKPSSASLKKNSILTEYWIVYISGSSSPLITQNLTNLVVPSFSYKVPPVRRTKERDPLLSTAAQWLEKNNKAAFLEDLSVIVPTVDRF